MFAERQANSANYNNPQSITVMDGSGGQIAYPLGTIIGGATGHAFGKRRFPIIAPSDDSFDEYREGATLATFVFTRQTTALSLGVTMLRDPSYSHDGLRMVFSGTIGSSSGIYMATRMTIDDAWSSPMLLRELSDDDVHPFLAADCKHLYWTRGGTIYHAHD